MGNNSKNIAAVGDGNTVNVGAIGDKSKGKVVVNRTGDKPKVQQQDDKPKGRHAK